MHRRAYLAAATAGLGGVLAGCLGNDSLDEEEVAVLDEWLQDAVDLVDEGQLRASFWLEEPGGVDVEAMATLESEAGSLLTRWDEDIVPKLDDLRNTDIDRTVANETWLVEGDDLADVLEDLREAVDAVRVGTGAVAAADGDPEEVEEDALSTLEELADSGRETASAAIDLWFRDALES